MLIMTILHLYIICFAASNVKKYVEKLPGN